MTGPILPPIPMLTGGGSSKVWLVLGIVLALSVMSKNSKDSAAAAMAAAGK